MKVHVDKPCQTGEEDKHSSGRRKKLCSWESYITMVCLLIYELIELNTGNFLSKIQTKSLHQPASRVGQWKANDTLKQSHSVAYHISIVSFTFK